MHRSINIQNSLPYDIALKIASSLQVVVRGSGGSCVGLIVCGKNGYETAYDSGLEDCLVQGSSRKAIKMILARRIPLL
ncbi:hypothetical protein SASPL_103749 [Salvia splendens]|uniref:Uncharacterized protein n=1 Tax=Salvia splendens TaxID=180675 RepID=A0A8X8YI16_SALSN|nr:hypothetical protein SASPL_103749 [Salvia splendens]